MRVHVASLGTGYLINLARELDKAGVLGRFFTAVPRFRVTGLPRERVVTRPLLLLPSFLLLRAGLGHLQDHFIWYVVEAFDRSVARTADECDVFHANSTYGLRTIRRVRSHPRLTVCDRGSSHVRVQDRLLRDEFARWGLPFEGIDPRFVAKEEAEYAEADLIVVPSTFARQSFLQQGVSPDKVVTVPFGVRIEDFFPTGKRDDVFRVLCVAQLAVRKGIGYLLEAFSSLKLHNAELVFRGVRLPETRSILARFEGCFHYSPPLSRRIGASAVPRERAELRDLFSQASVFVLASIEEGLAMVIAQAMACGVPVIATTNTGAADLITDGHDGFIVPIRDVDALRDRIAYLHSHPAERAAMGRAALETVRSLGGWSTYANRMREIYQERLARHGSGVDH